jgi:hypothetical protein
MENHMKPITMTFNENIASFSAGERELWKCGEHFHRRRDPHDQSHQGFVQRFAHHGDSQRREGQRRINLDSACLEVGLLLGDVNGDGVVDSADLDIVNNQIGQPTNGENFRSDINNDGTISAADVRIVTQQQGMRLP